MSDNPDTLDLVLTPEDNERLASLCGQLDEHLRQIERRLGVEISNRGNLFRLIGEPESLHAGEQVLRDLYSTTETESLTPAAVHLFLQESGVAALLERRRNRGFPRS